MATGWRLIDAKDGRCAVANLGVADGFWMRFVGWQFRTCPPAGHGLLLLPCASVHTCWMRFALDVIGLCRADKSLRWFAMCAVVHRTPPGGTAAVLELAAGGANGLQAGQYLAIDASGQLPLPASVSRLFDRTGR